MEIKGAEGNTVVASPETLAQLKGTLTFNGHGATVVIGQGVVARQIRLIVGTNARVEIGAKCNLGALIVFA